LPSWQKRNTGLARPGSGRTIRDFRTFHGATRMSGWTFTAEPQLQPDIRERAWAMAGRSKVPARQSRWATEPAAHPIRCIRKGAAEAVAKLVKEQRGSVAPSVMNKVDRNFTTRRHPAAGGRRSQDSWCYSSQRHRQRRHQDVFAQLPQNGHPNSHGYGDNHVTAAADCIRSGVDDSWRKPHRRTSSPASARNGRRQLIAMIGDGTNETPAGAGRCGCGHAYGHPRRRAKPATWWGPGLASNERIEVVEIGSIAHDARRPKPRVSIATTCRSICILPAMFWALLLCHLRWWTRETS